MVGQGPEQPSEVDWVAMLTEHGDEPTGWIQVTPEIVAIFSLRDCEEQLERSTDEPIRLAQAAKSAHLAMQAALTAALAGSMNIGAHPKELREQYLAFLQESSGKQPESNRVMAFQALLRRALEAPLEWSGKPLSITEPQQAMLDRLSMLRDGIEHTKQLHWAIEIAYILEAIPVAAQLTAELLEVVFHHLEPGELASVKATAASIEAFCGAKDPGAG